MIQSQSVQLQEKVQIIRQMEERERQLQQEYDQKSRIELQEKERQFGLLLN